MIFRQLFEPVSSTYSYLLGCADTGQALLIDPVLSTWGRDLAEVNKLGLTLAYTIETHIHADHIISAKKMKAIAGERSLEDFVALMNGLKLAYPKFIDYAVPGYRECGAGRQPIAVTDHANTLHQAIDGAAQKMKRSLDSTLGKLGDHKRKPSTPGSDDEPRSEES